jgi:hypothetical protein
MTRDELAAVPPREFVAARNALVEELRAAGEIDEAKQVARLRRPTPALWAVNRLAAEEPRAMEALLAAGKKLGAAQRALLSRGDREPMRDAESELRDAVLALVERGEALVGKSGAGLDRRIGDTLRAAATADEATRRKLAAGRLERELEPSTGFEGGAPLPRRRPPAKTKPSAAEAREARRRAAAAAREEKRKARLREKLERLRARVAEAEAALE